MPGYALSSISIHAPRVGGDSKYTEQSAEYLDFNPRPPCGGRLKFEKVNDPALVFQSTPPVWGATRPPRRN